MLPVGFTWIRYLESFYRSWDLGTKGIIQRIQRTFPVVRMMKMCWSTIRWYSSLALRHVAVSPPQFGHSWIEPTLWPYVIRNQNSQINSHLPSSSSARSCLASAELTYQIYSIASNSLMSLEGSCHCQVLLPSKAHQASTMFPRTASRFSNCSSYLFCTLLCLSNLIPNPKSSCKMEFLRFQAQIPSMDWWCHSNWQRKSTAYGHRHPHTIQMENKKLDARVLPQRTKTRIPLSKWRGFLLIAIIVCPSWFSKAH